jgi:rhodanese-related sulfurtransferase
VAIESTDPKGAHEALSSGSDGSLVDVRTVEEFDRGHPAGSVNVPWALAGDFGMEPNPDFVAEMQKRFGAEAKLYLSCQAGGRSLKACQDLEAAGFGSLVNVDGGFGGRRDPMGNLVVAGWAESGLPVTDEPSTYGQGVG